MIHLIFTNNILNSKRRKVKAIVIVTSLTGHVILGQGLNLWSIFRFCFCFTSANIQKSSVFVLLLAFLFY